MTFLDRYCEEVLSGKIVWRRNSCLMILGLAPLLDESVSARYMTGAPILAIRFCTT